MRAHGHGGAGVAVLGRLRAEGLHQHAQTVDGTTRLAVLWSFACDGLT